MTELSSNIILETYKTLTKQPFLEGDEKYISILTNWDDELFYEPEDVSHNCEKNVKKKTRTLKAIRPCTNCGNQKRGTFKSKSFFGVKARMCGQCGFRQ